MGVDFDKYMHVGDNGKLYLCGFEVGKVTYEDNKQMMVDISENAGIIVEKNNVSERTINTLLVSGIRQILNERLAGLGLDTNGWHVTKLVDDGDGLRLYMIKRLSDEVLVRVMFKVRRERVDLVKLQLTARSSRGKNFIKKIYEIIDVMAEVKGEG